MRKQQEKHDRTFLYETRTYMAFTSKTRVKHENTKETHHRSVSQVMVHIMLFSVTKAFAGDIDITTIKIHLLFQSRVGQHKYNQCALFVRYTSYRAEHTPRRAL